MLEVQIPDKLLPFLNPARYKVAYGGRGSAKSWSVARLLLTRARAKPTRVLCAREFQVSIKESVHSLLADQIKALSMEEFFDTKATEIVGANGSLFMFAGLKQNIANLKSYEGVDVVWVEEANVVSKASWTVLIPTIRKDGSEIWVTFNPELDSDETYKRFVIDPPADSIVIEINYRDNPWFPAVLEQERLELQRKDPDLYLNVWEGKCKVALEGAIYATELRAMTAEGRIQRVPYDPALPVECFWDLGWADNTSIIMAQFKGQDIRLIDHMSGSRRMIAEYLADLQARRYVYGEDWLPHDGEYGNVASQGKSVGDILREAGRRVRNVPRTRNVVADLDRVRQIFPRLLADQVKCADLLQSLRHYVWRTDDDGKTTGREPLHNHASHDADALRALAAAVDMISTGGEEYRRRRAGRTWKTA